ncbi:MAG TPA: LCP family protein [Capsulimonadaceae bacterium]|jgi:LCP family protein required for cell wall assembly
MGIPPQPPVTPRYAPDRFGEPIADIQRPARKPRKPLRRRKPSQWGPRLLVGFVGVVLLALGYGAYLAINSPIVAHMMQNPTVANQFPGVKSMNMLVIGRDYDYSNSDQVIRTKARSDMLMVAHLDFENNSVHMLSIPRDTRARIPGHGTHKINAAHAYGGPTLSAATVTRNYGIPVDHYMSLDFQGFEKAIDLMNGVNVTVDKKMDYDDNWGHLHIHLLPGEQHLNGNQTMGFVRFRHADNDMVRTARQQRVIAALKMKMLEPATLLAVPNILNTIDKHTESDFTTDQKIAIARFIKGAPKDKVEMQTLPSTEGNYYVYTDWQQATPLITQWFGVTPPKPTRDRHRSERFAAARRSKAAASEI